MRRATVGLAIGVIALFAAGQAHADDQLIARQVHQALSQHKEAGQLQGFGVDLKVEDGLVWLNGYVSSPEQQTLVLNAARHVGGVKGVVNALEIQGEYDAKPVSNLEDLRAQTTMLQQEAAARQMSAQARLAAEQQASAEAYARQEASAVQMRNAYQQSVSTAPRAAAPRPISYGVPQVASQPTAAPTPAPSPAAPREIGSGVSRVPTQLVSNRTAQPVQYAAAPMQAQPAPAYANQVDVQAGPVGVHVGGGHQVGVGPAPYYAPSAAPAPAVRYDHPSMPGYAWPSYAAYPNYGALTYPKQYSPTVWPYIGPFYPYPQVPLGWRKVTLEWDDGWWMLDFKDH